MIKSYKVRIYPTKEQEELMWKHIGSCRFIWNWMLAKQQEIREQGGEHLSAFDMINLLKPLKNDGEHGWLYDVSNTSLQKICRDLDEAYKKFFKKTGGFPKFKSRKKSKLSFPICTEKLYFKDEKFIRVQKIGNVRYRTDFTFSFGRNKIKFTNARISYVNGKWMLSFGIERENQTPILTDKPMGIDLGIKELAVVEYDGRQITFHNINKSKRMRFLNRELRRKQRIASRKYEANRKGKKYVKTKNIERVEAAIKKLHARIANIRQDYLHKTTHELVSMLPERVVMEDLNVSGMMKNKHLSRAISEQCFHEFIRQMKYKCEWLGIPFVQVDRFYPSSKTCSCCGNVKRNLKLSDRTYICESCGTVIDRDYNAAVNLSRYIA